MINFRFHLVSLTAVFLALAVGIGLGATVVDQATVDGLERRLRGVDERVNRTDRENEQIQRDLARWSRFSEEAGPEAVAGRLQGMSVLVVGVQGIDRAPVNALRQLLLAAGARLQGTVWFTSRLAMEKPQDATALAEILRLSVRSPEAVRRAAAAPLARALSGREPGLLVALGNAAFIEFDAQTPNPGQLGSLPAPDTLFAVVSGSDADVPNPDVVVPFVSELAQQTGGRVLAAEPGKESQGREPAERAIFVGPLRENGALNGMVSTVDNLEDFRGRFATVYALRDLFRGKVGHFGVGPRAERLVPETAT